MQLKQIILIHKKKFFMQVLESLCEKAGIQCYSLEDASDFSYLINDLKPEILLIDQEILKSEVEKVKENLELTNQSEFKTIILGDNNYGLNGDFLPAKIDVETLIDELSAQIASFN